MARSEARLVHTVRAPPPPPPARARALVGDRRRRLLGERRPLPPASRPRPDHDHPEHPGRSNRRTARRFTLTSPSFADGGVIPTDFTCTGAGLSPDLAWTGTPADTASSPSSCATASANGYLHWVVTGIDPARAGFGEAGCPRAPSRPRTGRRGRLAGALPAGGERPALLRADAPRPPRRRRRARADGAAAADLIEASRRAGGDLHGHGVLHRGQDDHRVPSALGQQAAVLGPHRAALLEVAVHDLAS